MSTISILAEVRNERRRQVIEEGFDLGHDDEINFGGRLSLASACYSLADTWYDKDFVFSLWPWPMVRFKPTTPRRNLIKAAALLIAEIERLDRAAEKVT